MEGTKGLESSPKRRKSDGLPIDDLFTRLSSVIPGFLKEFAWFFSRKEQLFTLLGNIFLQRDKWLPGRRPIAPFDVKLVPSTCATVSEHRIHKVFSALVIDVKCLLGLAYVHLRGWVSIH